jgi:bromodomain-containing factor 1
VPPVVEAVESDLRDTTSALALAPQPNLDQPRIPDFQVETEFSNHDMDGVMNDVGDAIYNTDMETRNADAAIPAPAFQTLTLNNGVTDHITPTDALPAEDAVSSFVDEQHTVRDADMTDPPVSASSTKVARERDDDNDDEPSAKRTKVEDDTTKTDIQSQQFPAAPEVPATAQDQDVAPVRSESITTITPYESKEIIKILKNVVRTANGKNFRKSVRALWPNFADAYYAKIPHPVDLATMENNLKEEKYPSMDDFKAEVDLLYENAVTFNGENHEVTASAKVVRDAILSKMASIPPEAREVAKAPKKQARRKSTPLAEPAPRIVTPRRQSKSGGTAAVAATTFALDPNTSTPLIRRDSTKGDGGRPKREIHPPKNKDLPYNTTARPKNKKVAQELKFCEEVLAELKKPKHSSYSNAFMFPVDPVSLNIPNYFQVIKHPMDISKIEEKLKGGQYQSAKAFEADVKLMFSNCYKFNPPSNVVHHWGKQFEEVFNQTLATKSKWFEDHAPAATPSSHGDSDDEESEEEAEAEEPALGIAAWSERLTEEQDKMITLMANPKKNAQLIDMQNDMIDMIKKKIANEKAKPVPKKEIKKPKAVRPAKKQAVAKKAAPAAKRKSTGGRQRYMGTHEKNIISIGIQQLPEDITKDILAMIKGETDVDVSNPQYSS